MPLDTPLPVSTVTLNSNTYPIYGTLARAAEYFDIHLDTTFIAANTTNRTKSLVLARRWLDRQAWLGTLTVASQPTSFPRTGISDKEGNPVDPTLVPLGIEFAEYELALILLKDPTKFNNANTSNNTKKAKAGEAEIEFFFTSNVDTGLLFPDQVLKLVQPFLYGSFSLVPIFYFGGTCTESDTVTLHDYGYSGGL